jgi:aromatic ring hydroxylase-like protein
MVLKPFKKVNDEATHRRSAPRRKCRGPCEMRAPLIVPDGTVPPPDAANTYAPTACPGGRAPHLWLADGRSLYDTFGFEWTLLRLRRDSPVTEEIANAARSLGLDLTVVDVDHPDARDLYEADAALIRPDHIVAWRGTARCKALQVVARASSAGRQTGQRERPHFMAVRDHQI